MSLIALRTLLCSLLLAIAGPVLAHSSLVSATPVAGSQVDAAPIIELTFNEALVERASRFKLGKVGDDGKVTPVEHPKIELVNGNKTLRGTPHPALAAGEYEVEWRVMGADNHPITGRHRFTIR